MDKLGDEDVLTQAQAERMRIAEEEAEKRLGRRLTIAETLTLAVKVLKD